MTADPQRTAGARLLALAAAVVLFAGFTGLGVWQLERRAWKLDLIARVEARVRQSPSAPPAPADWPGVSRARDEYRHVRISGTFEPGKETLVQAVTELGPGFWVMTPLRNAAGYVVLVNRGFTPPELKARAGAPTGQVTVVGLVRMSEPHGGFLRANQPAQDRWYSRDVAAIAQARGLGPVAPYFIDADSTPNAGGWPRGGLTVIRFRNSHLSYALTWFGMAALVAIWAGWAAAHARRQGRR